MIECMKRIAALLLAFVLIPPMLVLVVVEEILCLCREVKK